jgi:lipopolysaccharide transport system permease protein
MNTPPDKALLTYSAPNEYSPAAEKPPPTEGSRAGRPARIAGASELGVVLSGESGGARRAAATPQLQGKGLPNLKANAVAPFWPTARSVVYYRDLILVLLGKEFKLRYKSTFVGYAWSVLHPLVLAFIFLMFFSVFMRLAHFDAYALYLIAGLFPWQWIANTCFGANMYFLGNGSLIKKVRFQPAMLGLAGVLNESIHFACSLPVIVGFMLYYGRTPGLNWLWAVPALVVLQVLMMFGVGLAIGTCNLFFRDLERLVSLVVQLLFYLTPIVYPLEMVPKGYAWILYANPFAAIVICWQGLFYGGGVPAEYFGMAVLWACVWLALGLAIYSRRVWRFAEIV